VEIRLRKFNTGWRSSEWPLRSCRGGPEISYGLADCLCLTTLPLAQIVQRAVVGWLVITNRKGCGRKWLWLSLSLCLDIYLDDKSKGTFVSLHGMKACRCSNCISVLILNLGAWRRWVFWFTHRPLYDRGRTPVPAESKAEWAPTMVWRKEKPLAPEGIWTLLP
jgi:hypothetical protein